MIEHPDETKPRDEWSDDRLTPPSPRVDYKFHWTPYDSLTCEDLRKRAEMFRELILKAK